MSNKNTYLYLVDQDIYENDELKHFGIIGMKWGIRRFQNEDGTLTPEGRIRYGVGTVKETQKLSYSQDYMVLKSKKNRTEKEEEKLRRLENGKKHFEKSTFDEDYWNKLKDKESYEELENDLRCYEEYLKTTNYGKGMAAAEAMMAIPITAIGAAVDFGASYVQINAGLPFFVTGIGTTAGLGLGMNLGALMYANKNLEDLKNELTSKGKVGMDFDNVDAKKLNKAERYNLEVKESDLKPSEIKILKDLGLKPEDLAMDHDGYIIKKDGTPFSYKMNKKIIYREHLDDISDELDLMNNKIDLNTIVKADAELTSYKNKVDQLRKENRKNSFWQTQTVASAAEKAKRERDEDSAYNMVFANPQYYLNSKGQWTYEGKTYSDVDSLINAIMKNTTFVKL